MRLRVKRPDEIELNLISLVDVVLLLVIFFMLSTTFIQDSRLRVELPEAGSATIEPSIHPVIITISAQGSYRVNDRALVNNERATLSAALRQVAGGNTRQPITIRADARSTHQSVVTAMDVAARQGFTQVNIATVSQHPEE
ncbi:MAG TPA: biopolymer transporter ExbD [Steroidobacteraceae bacterium]|jgi:biopolymer transport protein ExbD|nr:biopolymer transporter ExbD [Steroidobacteraceae bacterium]